MTGYQNISTSTVRGVNGINYAYRRCGVAGERPLVVLQHFRGNLDNWDPALVDCQFLDRVSTSLASSDAAPRGV